MKHQELYIQGKEFAHIVKALSNTARLEIMDYIGDSDISVQTLTEHMGISKTAVLSHLNILEKAGFISTQYVSGTVGNQKVCRRLYNRLVFDFGSIPSLEDEKNNRYYETVIEVGNYFGFNIYPPCGLATSTRVIKKWDDPSVFMDSERTEASILWCAFGNVTYHIPLNIPFEDLGIQKIEIILEISSQSTTSSNPMLFLPDTLDPSRITDGFSDVSFKLGGKEIGSYLVQEYPRNKGGKYTPTWWKGANYGTLVRIIVNKNGTTINGNYVSGITLDDVLPQERLSRDSALKHSMRSADYLPFEIGIREDAEHISGFTIFGHSFGEHTCDIIARFYC